MAMILSEKYRDIPPFEFYKSRILRLFPIYYIGLLLAILVSYDAVIKFFWELSLGGKIFYIFQNLLIFGQDLSYLACVRTIANECANPIALTINPPAWSIAVELGFYLIAPFVVKSAKTTFLYFMVGVVYLISLNGLKFPLVATDLFRPAEIYALNYYFFASSFIFFGFGALAYHLNRKNYSLTYPLGVIAIILLAFTKTIVPFWQILFIGLAIPPLFQYTKDIKVDRIIGELSYPAYILHFPILLMLKKYVGEDVGKWPLSLGTIVAIMSFALGLILYFFIEIKINNFRHSPKFFDKTPKNKYFHEIITKVIIIIYMSIPVLSMGYLYYQQNYVLHDAKSIVGQSLINLTDANWVKGVGRSWAGFFVVNNPENTKLFSIGTNIKFSNGEVRSVINIIKGQDFMNIYLNGVPLNGDQVGYPNSVQIIK